VEPSLEVVVVGSGEGEILWGVSVILPDAGTKGREEPTAPIMPKPSSMSPQIAAQQYAHERSVVLVPRLDARRQAKHVELIVISYAGKCELAALTSCLDSSSHRRRSCPFAIMSGPRRQRSAEACRSHLLVRTQLQSCELVRAFTWHRRATYQSASKWSKCEPWDSSTVRHD
jgi:hypothetical protein